jgi:hypothetical protein
MREDLVQRGRRHLDRREIGVDFDAGRRVGQGR